jgi:hypothetical protein
MQSQCALPLECTICIAAVTVLCAISAEPSSTPLPLLQSCKASRAKGVKWGPPQVTRRGPSVCVDTTRQRAMKASGVRNRCRGLWACLLMQSVQVGAVGVLQYIMYARYMTLGAILHRQWCWGALRGLR